MKVCAPDWPVRSDEFEVIGLREGDEVVGATWLTDGSETLAFVASDASLLRFAASVVRPQGLKGGGMAGINLAAGAEALFFGAVRTDDPEHGDPMVVTSTGASVKVTPFGRLPGEGPGDRRRAGAAVPQGRDAAGGRLDRSRPVGATRVGEPVELPAEDPRRDGSGTAMPGPDLVGHLFERG